MKKELNSKEEKERQRKAESNPEISGSDSSKAQEVEETGERDHQEEEEEDWERLEEELDHQELDKELDKKLCLDSENSIKLQAKRQHSASSLSSEKAKKSSEGLYTVGSTTTLLVEDFPVSFKTVDICTLFDAMDSTNVKIKWIDDTSALATFPNSIIAKRAYLKVAGHPFITISPYTNESKSSSIDFKFDDATRAARPAMTDMVARRLIAGALGVRPKKKSSQEQENDTMKLDQAREMRENVRRERQAKVDSSNALFDS